MAFEKRSQTLVAESGRRLSRKRRMARCQRVHSGIDGRISGRRKRRRQFRTSNFAETRFRERARGHLKVLGDKILAAREANPDREVGAHLLAAAKAHSEATKHIDNCLEAEDDQKVR